MLIYCYTYFCIHWLLLLCPLTRDQTHNLSVLGRHSSQLSYPARANSFQRKKNQAMLKTQPDVREVKTYLKQAVFLVLWGYPRPYCSTTNLKIMYIKLCILLNSTLHGKCSINICWISELGSCQIISYLLFLFSLIYIFMPFPYSPPPSWSIGRVSWRSGINSHL